MAKIKIVGYLTHGSGGGCLPNNRMHGLVNSTNNRGVRIAIYKKEKLDIAPTMTAGYWQMCTNNLLFRQDGYAGLSVVYIYEKENTKLSK